MYSTPGLGSGRRQQGPHEFAFIIDHDIPYGLGYIPSEDDARHMARLRRDRVRARLSGFPFDYPFAHTLFSWLTILPKDQSMHPTQKKLTMFWGWLRFGAFNRP